jgi:cytochrome c551/c552
MNALQPTLILLLAFATVLMYSACTSDYICPDSFPCDQGTIVECDSNLVYFQRDVLPILVSNCAISGCHDQASATNGVILDSYEDVMNQVQSNLPDESNLYRVITSTDPAEVMPIPPTSPLSSDQIQIIRDWIEEGALDLTCDSTGGGDCDIVDVSWSQFVKPTIDANCLSCHNDNNQSGGVNLSSIANVRATQSNNRFFGSINHDPGFSQMPQSQARLDQCTIDKIKSWIDEGMRDN